MKRKLTILITIVTLALSAFGQVNDNVIRQRVLKKAIVDSLFVFGKWTEDGNTETHLKYLGKVLTVDGHVYKIINSSWFWGLSHRATSRILVYNEKNKYLGSYNLAMISDLPNKLENAKLIFSNREKEDCDKSLITEIDLSKGLPAQIFLKCDGEGGDLYNFDCKK